MTRRLARRKDLSYTTVPSFCRRCGGFAPAGAVICLDRGRAEAEHAECHVFYEGTQTGLSEPQGVWVSTTLVRQNIKDAQAQ